MSTHEALREFEEALTALENSHLADSPPLAPESPLEPHAPLPLGLQPMLEAQVAEALKIILKYAGWLHDPGCSMRDCFAYGDALGRMMTASAVVGSVAARLQKGDTESRHRVIVEYAAPRKGEGSRKVENE